MRVAKEFRFRGMVQGVGFRWTAKRIADDCGVDGWVRNDADGGVSLVVEGGSEAVETFLDRLREAMSGHIDGEVEKTVSAGKNRWGFDVVH